MSIAMGGIGSAQPLRERSAVGSLSATRELQSVRPLAHRLILMGVDLVAIAASSVIAVSARKSLPWFDFSADIDARVAPWALAISLGWLVMLTLFGSHNPRRFGIGSDEFRRLVAASLATGAAIGVSAYLLQYELSRGYFFLLFAIGIPALVLGRAGLRWGVHVGRRRGHLLRPVLVAGDPVHAEEIVRVLGRDPRLGFRVVGVLTRAPASVVGGVPVLGEPSQTAMIATRAGAGAVIFAEGSFEHAGEFALLARAMEDSATDMVVAPSISDISAARLAARPMAGLPLLFVDHPRSKQASRWSKRTFDLVISSLLLLLAAPVIAIAMVAIHLHDGGPVVFRQRRVGLKGTEFTCVKLRTMAVDAEQRLAELRRAQDDGVLFKLTKDPRITGVGGILRRFSIDELPQLWNVVRGDMSLVGPRPALPGEVQKYEEHVLRRLDVPPGITGLWQVSGRSDLPWDETVRLDLYYVDNWSMFQDLAILLRTFRAVISGRGAY